MAGQYTAEIRREASQGKTYLVLLEDGITMYESALLDGNDWFIVIHTAKPDMCNTMSLAEEIFSDAMRWVSEGKQPQLRHKVSGEKHYQTYWYKQF